MGCVGRGGAVLSAGGGGGGARSSAPGVLSPVGRVSASDAPKPDLTTVGARGLTPPRQTTHILVHMHPCGTPVQ